MSTHQVSDQLKTVEEVAVEYTNLLKKQLSVLQSDNAALRSGLLPIEELGERDQIRDVRTKNTELEIKNRELRAEITKLFDQFKTVEEVAANETTAEHVQIIEALRNDVRGIQAAVHAERAALYDARNQINDLRAKNTVFAEENDSLKKLLRERHAAGLNDMVIAAGEWNRKTFGALTFNSPAERGYRLYEEAVETAQTCGCDPATLDRIKADVLSKPMGRLPQELGGVFIAWAVAVNALGYNAVQIADDAMVDWYIRTDEIRRKHQKKVEAGRAIDIPRPLPVDPPSSPGLGEHYSAPDRTVPRYPKTSERDVADQRAAAADLTASQVTSYGDDPNKPNNYVYDAGLGKRIVDGNAVIKTARENLDRFLNVTRAPGRGE